MLKKIVRITIIVLIVLFVGIQFIQPAKNAGEETNRHLFKQVDATETTQLLLKNACFDCHSNQTKYLWYHKISPVSWYINHHIVEGKAELNFSEWGNYSAERQMKKLMEISEELSEKKMPLKSYSLMHKEARLSEEDIIEISLWAETQSAKYE